jgi:uncharacterized protein with von Willebrand factor type A (vWA) domain
MPADTSLIPRLLTFGRLLRQRGLEVHMGRMLDVIEALQHVDIGSRDEVFHTCRTLLVHRHEDLSAFDRAFDEFWGSAATDTGHAGAAPGPTVVDRRESVFEAVEPTSEDAATEPTGESREVWSNVSTLATKDFSEFTPEEVGRARAALDKLTWTPGERRTRRWVSGRGPQIDLRRALARSVRTGGDVISLPRRRRRRRPRTIVLLCDVSGSMEGYSRMLLHFAHVLGRRHRVEAFLFSTRLTRVTPELRTSALNAAVNAVSRAVPDWSGGTRIGESLREFHQRWRRRTLHGGPVVLLISDGWDRGDPALLRDQIARLRRSCHRLVWLNPLIGTADYAPLTRGLQAALPFIDDFLPARTLTNLADLAVQLNTLSTGTPQRRSLRN